MAESRILVIDDDEMARKILADFFCHEGYMVFCAADGEEGMERFEKDKPHLVILDLLLPRMNGFEVFKKIKATSEGKRTPVILISAVYKSPEFQEGVLKDYDAAGYLRKPFKLEDLRTHVQTLLKNRGH